MSSSKTSWRSKLLVPQQNRLLRFIVLSKNKYIEYFGEYAGDGEFIGHVSQEGDFPDYFKIDSIYAWNYIEPVVSNGKIVGKINIVNF